MKPSGLGPKVPMKDSGVDWIGEVPAHWTIHRVKHVARLESGHTPSRSVPEHWLESNDIPWVSLNDTKWLSSHDYIADTAYSINTLGLQNSSARLLPAQAVVFTRDATIGKAAITTRPMAVSQHIIAWLCGPAVIPEYLLHVFYAMESSLERYTFGATLRTIGMTDVGCLVTPVPPREEQERIIAQLRARLPKVDALIAKQEQLLALFAEKRQGLITQAVTKGLDPNVPMKDSGVEWIGEVPAHWAVTALSTRYQTDLGKMLSPDVTDGPNPLPYLANQHVRWDHVVVEDLPTMSIDPLERERFTLRNGDLLVCEGGEVGRTAMWRGEIDMCAYQKALHRLRARDEGDVARYMYFALVSAAGRGLFEAEGNRSTFVHLTGEKLKRHRFPFPPTAEQEQIAGYLDRALDRLDGLAQRAQAMVEKLREYRQVIITAAVTGQLDAKNTAEAVGA
jgi:type I restriction enzyme S subunit